MRKAYVPGEMRLPGRGTATNPPNRFERLRYEADVEDAAATPDPEAPALRTEFFRDATRKILATNDSPDIPFDVSLNPYRGCEHGCAYCYARPTHEYLGFSAGLDFESKILVKEDAPGLLRTELSRKGWRPQTVALSGVTDPYQPVERRLRVTRRCLEVFLEFRNPVGLVTKSDLVVRDADLLAAARAAGARWAGFVPLRLPGAGTLGRVVPRPVRPPAPALPVTSARRRERPGEDNPMARPEAPVERLRTTWRSLSAKPGGKWLFSKLFSRFIPYSGSVTPEILELSPGRAVIAIGDRRRVRNHLRCVHAIALANVGEMSTGLALGFGMPNDSRSILVRLSCEYLKKARGRLVATAEAPAVASAETRDYEVTSVIRDDQGDVVAKTVAVWKVGPGR